ncbi:hypothetical protein ACN28S_39305 [Cystobacter fuscus]
MLRLRLFSEAQVPAQLFGESFDTLFAQRIAEADEFYDSRLPRTLSPEERRVARQAYAGLMWTKQFYHYAVKPWMEGDPAQPAPPPRVSRGATGTGGTCTTGTSSRCRTSGSTPGTRRGTSPST